MNFGKRLAIKSIENWLNLYRIQRKNTRCHDDALGVVATSATAIVIDAW